MSGTEFLALRGSSANEAKFGIVAKLSGGEMSEGQSSKNNPTLSTIN